MQHGGSRSCPIPGRTGACQPTSSSSAAARRARGRRSRQAPRGLRGRSSRTRAISDQRRHGAVQHRDLVRPPGDDARSAHRTSCRATAARAIRSRRSRARPVLSWPRTARRPGAIRFHATADGTPYLGNLRGPDYMRFLRRRVIGAGVRVLDHHPALELLGDGDGVAGAAGIDRQLAKPWQARASAVVLATGGCAFGERFIGATGLTGDGYLMAAEAGAVLSGMEMSAQYAVAPAGSSLNKGMPFRWATFYDAGGRELASPATTGRSRSPRLSRGPVFARLDKADRRRARLAASRPAQLLPALRPRRLDPFTDSFEITCAARAPCAASAASGSSPIDCATGVAGLFAAGDVASREDLVGAITGGGGPNASWAIASGLWAGEAAAAMPRAATPSATAAIPTARATSGMRRPAGDARERRPRAADVYAAVRAQMLPLDRNFFRTGDALPLARRLDALWSAYAPRWWIPRQTPMHARDRQAPRGRSMLACARWSLTSALARRESRGMHRRTDYPAIPARMPQAASSSRGSTRSRSRATAPPGRPHHDRDRLRRAAAPPATSACASAPPTSSTSSRMRRRGSPARTTARPASCARSTARTTRSMLPRRRRSHRRRRSRDRSARPVRQLRPRARLDGGRMAAPAATPLGNCAPRSTPSKKPAREISHGLGSFEADDRLNGRVDRPNAARPPTKPARWMRAGRNTGSGSVDASRPA